jgi:hypothetical protein
MPVAQPIDIVFSFDTTGSMYSCLGQVRRKVQQTCERLFKQIPNLHIGIIGHGDYCDGKKVITIQELTDDIATIVDFVKTVPATGGGDAPEAYELVLHKVRSMNWRAGKSKVLVLLGDDVPHGPSYPQNKLKLDWRNELKLLLEAGINVHGVQCLARRHATHFYKEVAEVTGGFHLELHQFNAINDIVMAVCYQQDSEDALAKFEAEVEESGRMTDVVGACFDVMAGRPKREVRVTASSWRGSASAASIRASSKIDIDKLEPVHPARFQVLPIDAPVAIKGFVTDNGLSFKKGRGFYEFTKTVTVQPYKEVVLVDDGTGAMFSGADARTMIGLPKEGSGGNVKLRPGPLAGFTAFIQSTSVNRKLLAGTKFLYENEDWDRGAEA